MAYEAMFATARRIRGMFLVFRLDWLSVLFIVCFMCEIVDIVPVSTVPPLGVDQEQLFE
jgi:hypothetical protein